MRTEIPIVSVLFDPLADLEKLAAPVALQFGKFVCSYMVGFQTFKAHTPNHSTFSALDQKSFAVAAR